MSRTCFYEKCDKRSSFNYKNMKPLYCKIHSLEGMINLRKYVRTCQNENCIRSSSYNYPGEIKRLYCSEHKLENMVNIKHKNCKHEKCIKKPCFNYKGEKAKFCLDHKLKDMIDITSRRCNNENCEKRPSFNYKGKKALYCLDHKLKDMIDVFHKRCNFNMCDIIVTSKKYDGYCTHCFANLFPNDPRTLLIHKKSKEIKVVSYITTIHKGWFHDKPLYVDLKGGCCNSKRRIDLRKLINGTLLCIEIDENQHKGYSNQDEINRYDNLFMDYSGKYIFIRYNPDKFKSGNKNKNPKFKTRMDRLQFEIEKQTDRIHNNKNKELVEIIKIYYDN